MVGGRAGHHDTGMADERFVVCGPAVKPTNPTWPLIRPLAVSVSVQMIRWACGALRPGRFDPFVVLVLRCLRLAFHPLLWGGLVVAALRGFLDNELVRLDSPGDIVAALRTPFVGVAIAIGVRFGASVLAFVAAYPVARGDLMTSGGEARPALLYVAGHRPADPFLPSPPLDQGSDQLRRRAAGVYRPRLGLVGLRVRMAGRAHVHRLLRHTGGRWMSFGGEVYAVTSWLPAPYCPNGLARSGRVLACLHHCGRHRGDALRLGK